MRKLLLILIVFGVAKGFAQQAPQYTQYTFNNFGYNPAFAGTSKCITFKAGSRLQWVGMEGAPRTSFASVYKTITKPRNQYKGKHAVGLYLEQDGIHFTTRTYIKGAYAYHKKLGLNLTGAVGVFAGVQQYAVDFEGNYSDPVLDNIDGSVLHYPDIMPGLLLYNKKSYYSFSINQLYFHQIELGGEGNQHVNQYMFGFGNKGTYGQWTMLRSLLIKANYIAPPAVDLNVAWNYLDSFGFGLGYRVGEAVSAQLKLKLFGGVKLGYSFDFPLNKLYGNYSHEIMISFSKCGDGGPGGTDGVKHIPCPAYN